MDVRLPPAIEALPLHREKLERLCAAASDDERILGVVVTGSVAKGNVDDYSDLDTRIVVKDDDFDAVLAERDRLIDSCGTAVARFTADHLGFPEVIIVLYDDLVHHDFGFKRLSETRPEYEGYHYFVAWERDSRVTEQMEAAEGAASGVDVEWFEARMWTWSWYVQTKLLRGELYEALDGLQYMRNNVLFPLLAVMRGQLPAGSRRAEQLVGDLAAEFSATASALDRNDLMTALRTAMKLYVTLADPLLEKEGVARNESARRVVTAALEQGLDWKPSY